MDNRIEKQHLLIDKEEPLKKEIVNFVNLVKDGKFNIADSVKAKDALALACKIEKIIKG